MIYKNDRFLFNGSAYRLLHNDAETDRAWAIDINADKAWPREFIWSRISKLKPYVRKKGIEAIAFEAEGDEPPELPMESGETTVPKSLAPSPSMTKVKNKALDLLGYLVDTDASYPQIFDADERGPMILQRATEVGCSVPTIYKHLRQYWLGGQTPSALLGNFHRCGRTATGVTGGRGATPEVERSIYQLGERDIANFEGAIQEYFLKSGSLFGMTDTHQKLLEDYYQVADGNGDESPLPEGERPSFRQFQYYVKKAYWRKRLPARYPKAL